MGKERGRDGAKVEGERMDPKVREGGGGRVECTGLCCVYQVERGLVPALIAAAPTAMFESHMGRPDLRGCPEFEQLLKRATPSTCATHTHTYIQKKKQKEKKKNGIQQ